MYDRSLPAELNETVVNELMRARREKGAAMRAGDTVRAEEARQRIGFNKNLTRGAGSRLVVGRRTGLKSEFG